MPGSDAADPGKPTARAVRIALGQRQQYQTQVLPPHGVSPLLAATACGLPDPHRRHERESQGRGHGAVDRQNERHTVRISSLATFPRSRARLTGKVMY